MVLQRTLSIAKAPPETSDQEDLDKFKVRAIFYFDRGRIRLVAPLEETLTLALVEKRCKLN